MNKETFRKLTEMQAELNNYIAREKQIYMPDYTTERILALQVEFNELLNELPFLFKYWSSKQMNREKALEEYVDGIHFLLSIAIDLGINEYQYTRQSGDDMKKMALGISQMIIDLPEMKDFKKLMDAYLYFGEQLGFSLQEVIKAYMEKNKTNKERQENGY